MFERVINVGIRSNYYSCFVTTISLFFSSFSLDFLSSFFFFYYSIRNNRIDRMHKATRCVESIRRKGIRVADWNDTRKEKIDRRYLPLTVLKNWDRLRQTVFSPSLFFSSSFLSSYSSELSVFRKYFQRHSSHFHCSTSENRSCDWSAI